MYDVFTYIRLIIKVNIPVPWMPWRSGYGAGDFSKVFQMFACRFQAQPHIVVCVCVASSGLLGLGVP